MILRKNNSKQSFLTDIGLVFIILSLLIPVSNVKNSMNIEMEFFAYIVLLFTVVYLIISRGNINIDKKNLLYSIIYVMLFAVFSFLTMLFNPELKFKSVEMLRFTLLLLVLNMQKPTSGHFRYIIILYSVVSALIIIVGLGEFCGNEIINDFLSTYYVNHYAHIYIVMIQLNKTVTFFATHSIAAYIYSFLFMGWEFYSNYYKSKISLFFRIALFLLIILCKSTSSILCCALILSYYFIKNRKNIKKNKYDLISWIFLLIIGVICIMKNYDIVNNILQSEANGILGRYYGGDALLKESIKNIFSFNIPTGFYNLSNLIYTDSAYVVYMLRGGVLLLIVIYLMLLRLLKRVCDDKIICKTLFVFILFFDMGYPVLISQRFVSAFLLVLYFISNCSYHIKNQ